MKTSEEEEGAEEERIKGKREGFTVRVEGKTKCGRRRETGSSIGGGQQHERLRGVF